MCPMGKDPTQLRRLAAATFDGASGVCYLPAYPPFLTPLLNDLHILFPKVEFTDKAKAIIASGRKLEKDFDDRKLPEGFKFKTVPYAHQQETLLYSLYHYRCGLLLDTGIGKSKVATDLICATGEKTLLIVPPSLVSNWEGEFAIHSSKDLNVLYIKRGMSAAKKKAALSSEVGLYDVLVIGYETANIYKDLVAKNFPYKMIILDECQRIKNIKSQRTKGILELSGKAYRRIAMSGTAVLNKPTDLYPVFQFLSPQILNQDYFRFCQDYLEHASWNRNVVVGVKNLDKLNQKVRKYTVRYLKEQCLDLPERMVIDKHIKMAGDQLQMYYDLSTEDDLYLDEGIVSKTTKLVALGKMNQVTGGFMYVSEKDPKICDNCVHMANCVEAKVKPYTKFCQVVQKEPPVNTKFFKSNPKLEICMELVDEILHTETGKVLIWCKATAELDMLEAALVEAGTPYIRVKKDPKTELEVFNTESLEFRVVISNIGLGVGFTANAADYSIYYSLTFNLEHYLQSIDRNYRIGQKKKVIVYRLIAEDSIDLRVIEAINNKQDIAEALLTNLQCNQCKNLPKCTLLGIRQHGPGCLFVKKKRVIA
jgi:SNF2 family DNA or RNA helicase